MDGGSDELLEFVRRRSSNAEIFSSSRLLCCRRRRTRDFASGWRAAHVCGGRGIAFPSASLYANRLATLKVASAAGTGSASAFCLAMM